MGGVKVKASGCAIIVWDVLIKAFSEGFQEVAAGGLQTDPTVTESHKDWHVRLCVCESDTGYEILECKSWPKINMLLEVLLRHHCYSLQLRLETGGSDTDVRKRFYKLDKKYSPYKWI